RTASDPPGGSLCSLLKAVYWHLQDRDLQELRSSLQLMDKLQRQILEDTEPFRNSLALQQVSYQLDKEGEHFGLTLDTQGFSPEDLSVRQVGRKLRVSGKTEKKQEDGKGSYSYSLQEFRQEFDLCHLSPDGKLHIQAAKVPCIEGTERADYQEELRGGTTAECVFTGRRQQSRNTEWIIDQT
uniref:SHSP domain-containing protein n=1 Tax=Poecilia reticulata TaxID=8081 RepID=A0A3P9MUK6_POERE